jgi:hypothetical protein
MPLVVYRGLPADAVSTQTNQNHGNHIYREISVSDRRPYPPRCEAMRKPSHVAGITQTRL